MPYADPPPYAPCAMQNMICNICGKKVSLHIG